MVFHKHKLVFVAVPKTGTTSIVRMLRNQTDDYDGSGHIPYSTILQENDSDLMNEYYSFGVVRHPYDIFISAYEQLKRDGSIEPDVSIEEMVIRIFDDIKAQKVPIFNDLIINQVWAPQYYWLGCRNRIMVDKILRFENLEADWNDFVKFQNDRNLISNIPRIPLLKYNQGNYEKYSLTESEKELIYDLYKIDFELFNYKK